jgi:hypothetical protein
MTTLKNITGSLTKVFLLAALAVFLCFGSASLAQAQTAKPDLYLVSVGVSTYQNKYAQPDLPLCTKDATDLANLLQGQQGKLFGRVETQPLLTEKATANDILASLQAVKAKANANAYTILYFATHGGTDAQGKVAIYAYDRKMNWSEIQTALRGMPGQVFVILDVCHAGAVPSGDNLIVFSSCLADQTSGDGKLPDGTPNQNGWFTKALLEGLNGAADYDHNGTVTLAELNTYISNRLQQTTMGKQTSTFLPPPNVPGTLPLAQVTPTQPAPGPVTTVSQPVPVQVAPVAPVAPVAVPKLVGTTWKGQESIVAPTQFTPVSFQFLQNGQVMMTCPDGAQVYTGTYSQQGNQVTISLPGAANIYQGTINGTTFSGQAVGSNNIPWHFSVTLQ